MLFAKYLFLVFGLGLMATAVALAAYDLRRVLRPVKEGDEDLPEPAAVRWRAGLQLAGVGFVLVLLSLSILVIPSGMGGVRVSQISGTQAGVLEPGVHWITPLIDSVETYDLRDRVFVTLPGRPAKDPAKDTPETATATYLEVQTKEGLLAGIAAAVRYRIDPKRLAYVHANLPQPLETEIVAPAVLSVFRQVAPTYMTREFFATRREEVRRQSVEAITRKLSDDGLVVKEVLLQDIVLPPEYAKGLEGLLIKEQENEMLTVEMQIKEKMVETARLEAEAEKARRVKEAEAMAQVRVLQAKAEADAMQHTLPLKEKQIEQTRLEAEARKEATLKNADAAAQAKVIDAKAELEKRHLMSQADAHHTEIMARADAERLKLEANVLKENPLLIQKIIAERLSDKVQIMMVPTDGKFFFANDVLRAPQIFQNGAVADQR